MLPYATPAVAATEVPMTGQAAAETMMAGKAMGRLDQAQPLTRIDLYLDKIRTWAGEQGFTAAKLARVAGVPRAELIDMFDPARWNPHAATLRKVELYIISLGPVVVQV
jgi:hypothetical protein